MLDIANSHIATLLAVTRGQLLRSRTAQCQHGRSANRCALSYRWHAACRRKKASRYSYHGARHFLTNCSRAKGDSGDTQLEPGAWCGSDIALTGQTPREAKKSLRDIQ